MNARKGSMAVALCCLLCLGSATGAAGGESAENPLDPIVRDVIEMLEAGVGEEVILRWLDSTQRRPTDIGRAGMIGLSAAGASEELMQALLERLSEPGAGVAPPASPPAASAAADAGRQLETVVELRAKRVWTDEDEPDSPRARQWNVYLYLDGEFVAWSAPSQEGTPVEVRRSLQPGPHELRVILQRYEKIRGDWSYESLTIPTLVAFDTRSQDPLEIEVEMERSWGLWRQRKGTGPLSYRVRQGQQVLAEASGAGGDPDRWVPVCEDVEANFPDKTQVPGRFRSDMSQCVRWAELWTGAGRSTSREEILARLAVAEFEPAL